MTSESVRRGAFICQECYATSFDTEPEAVKHENAYGHSTVWSPANPTPRSEGAAS